MSQALDTANDRFQSAASADSAPSSEQLEASATVRRCVVELAAAIEELVPTGRNKSLALTHLEDVHMRANRAIFMSGPFV